MTSSSVACQKFFRKAWKKVLTALTVPPSRSRWNSTAYMALKPAPAVTTPKEQMSPSMLTIIRSASSRSSTARGVSCHLEFTAYSFTPPRATPAMMYLDREK